MKFALWHLTIFLPSAFLFFGAISVAYGSIPIAQQPAPVENSIEIARLRERIDGTRDIHKNDVDAIRESLRDHSAAMSRRFDTVERNLFWLFTGGGGVGALVGGDIVIRVRAERARRSEEEDD